MLRIASLWKRPVRFAAFGLVLSVDFLFAQPQPAPSPLPDVDLRRPAVAIAAAPARVAAEATLRARVSELQVDRHEIVGSPKWIMSRDGFLTGPNGLGRAMAGANAASHLTALSANDPHRLVKAFVNEHPAVFGHDAAALERARVDRDYVTTNNGVRTTIWFQEHEGVEIFEANFMAHVSKSGELINVASQFIPDPGRAAQNGRLNRPALDLAAPPITVERALAVAAQHLGQEDAEEADFSAQSEPVGASRRQRFQSRLARGNVHARLVWLPMGESEMRLCWEVALKAKSRAEVYRLLLDAETGEVLVRRCQTVDISNASYRVYTGDSPTPLSPGHNAPGNSTQPATVSRTLVTLSAINTTASPNGWINDGVNETRGNNVDASTDHDGDDALDLPRPTGSPSRVFDFTLSLNSGPLNYGPAAAVNLFYWCNWMHDKLWELGFDEPAGNFQNDNFGRNGIGNDALRAEAQDGDGENNANFNWFYPADGNEVWIQMYLWPDATPDRDGDFDTEIMIHEYTHGLSTRLVGGGVGMSATQSKGMGEGWSDFFALTLLSQAGDNLNGVYAVAAYVLKDYHAEGYPVFTDNYYYGLRKYPYSTDLAKDPLTFKDIDFNQDDPHVEVPSSPRRDFSPSQVHSQGTVWCSALWDARANLIAKHGFATGNQLILQLVINGMKLSPANPNFLQARDAILQADQNLTGGANKKELWDAFAKRGMGLYATSPASTTTSGVLENFDVFDSLRITPLTVAPIEGPLGGPFPSTQRAFILSNSGPSTLAWNVVLEPPLETTITSGTLLAGATRTVGITLDANAVAFFPLGNHMLDVTFSNQTSHVGLKRTINLVVKEEKSALTETFDTTYHPFDLEFRQVTFTPSSSNDYEVCRSGVASFPNSTVSATTLNIPEDGFIQVDLTNGKHVSLFGHQYSSIYVCEDGSLAMQPSEFDFLDTYKGHFDVPRVSAFLTSLTPAPGDGRISCQQLSDRFVATWDKVWFGGFEYTNRFQIEMFFNGMIRMTFLTMEWPEAVTGLSSGGEFADDTGADFLAAGNCALAPLAVTAPQFVTEGSGVRSGAGTVSVKTRRSSPLIVNLASSDTSELTVPASVIIPSGESSADFDITVVNDSVRDGSQLVYLTATALNHIDALTRVRVDDNEAVTLSVTVPLFANEASGSAVGTVSMNGAASGVVTVNLLTSPTNEIIVPPVVFIAAGQTSTVFQIQIIDDKRIDGNHQTTVAASVPNWTSGSDVISIFDNEDTQLRMWGPIFITEGAGTLTNAGEVYLSGTLTTNLMVSLYTSNIFDLFPFGPVVIPAGQTNVKFTISVGDNAQIDGVRQTQLAATAPGFSNGFFSPFVFDNDQPPDPTNPYPPDGVDNWSINTHLAWTPVEAELLANGNFESGDLTGWTVGGAGGGGFLLNNGTYDPDSPDGPLPPLGGNYSSLSVQFGNGEHTLAQEFYIPDGATSVTLSWQQEIRNHAGQFAANHRFAVELRDADDNALLATLFSTQPGDAPFSGPTNRTANLKPWRGEHVRVVFVEEDALGHLNVHLDNVSLIAGSAAPTTFDVYFGNDATPDEGEYVGTTSEPFWQLPQLAGGPTYYWQIVVKRGGITNAGPVWSFSTVGTSTSTTLLPFGSVWRVNATGADLRSGWRSTTYNDSSWPSAAAPLGFGSSQTTTIGVASNGYTTFYFRRRVTLNDTNRLGGATVHLKRDDGAVVYVNGFEVLRDNMPAGPILYDTPASAIVNGADETNSFIFPIDHSHFVEGTNNVIAVEVHQRHNGFPFPGPSPDLFFDLALTIRTNTGNLAPTWVSWVAPADFAVVRAPTNLLVRPNFADDNILTVDVDVFADGIKIGSDTLAPFSVVWSNAPIGPHKFVAVATDSSGLSCTSPPLHVIVAPAVGQQAMTLVPADATWRYRENGFDPGPDWKTIGYREARDRSWQGGPGQLGYGDGDEATVFDIATDVFGKPIAAYFRHVFTNQMTMNSAQLRVLRDDGVAVYLNNSEIFRNNLPGGTIRSNTLALTSVTGAAENAWLSATVPLGFLNSGANIIAAEVHQASANNVDLSFDLELSAIGNPHPMVALTAPVNNAQLVLPPGVALAANAIDPYGSVTSVEFFADGASLGVDSAAPYEALWNNPTPGLHTLTARALDADLASSTSAPVIVNIVGEVALAVQQVGLEVEISWLDNAPGYHLEAAADLTTPITWQSVTNPVTQTNGYFRVLVVPTETERYFRLRAP